MKRATKSWLLFDNMVYFAYGFPSSYRLSGEDDVVLSCWNANDTAGEGSIVVMTRTDVQLWSSGQNRYLMGSCRVCNSGDGYILSGCVARVSEEYRIALVTSESQVVVVSYEECLAQGQLAWATALEEYALMECNVDVLVRETIVNTDDEIDGTLVIGMCGDETCFSVVYQSGDFVTYSWSGEVLSRRSPLEFVHLGEVESGEIRVTNVTYLEKQCLLGFVFENGMVVVIRGDGGLQGMCSGRELVQTIAYTPDENTLSYACIARFHPDGQYVAVGTKGGTVTLCDISMFVNDDGTGAYQNNFTILSLEAWGYECFDIGNVSALEWSPDGRAVAVGYGRKGMTVWSTRGCRLFSSLPPAYNEYGLSGPFSPRSLQTTYSSKSGVSSQKISAKESFDSHVSLEDKDGLHSPRGQNKDSVMGLFDNGISYISWSKDGGHVLVHEKKSPVMFDLTFARCCHNHLILTSKAPIYNDSPTLAGIKESKASVLICSDRLLLIQEVPPHTAREKGDRHMDAPQLSVQHVRVPQQYLDSAFPIVTASLNMCGTDIVVAGSHGIGLYSIVAKRWRLIGDVSQDKAIKASHVGWIHDDVILVCATISGGKNKRLPDSKAALLLFSKGYLDASSILAFENLDSIPLILDISNGRISLVFEDGSVQILQYTIEGGADHPVERVELSLEFTFKVPNHIKARSLSIMRKRNNEDELWCIILGQNGEIGCIDIQRGSYSVLGHNIDYYWIPHYEGHFISSKNSMKPRFDLPWWTYGKAGMTLWFDNIPLEVSRNPANVDPELEFDAEVLPIGICLQDLSILGVMHRSHRKQHYSNPASSVDFAPLPESQPVLACLLRRLLRREKFQDALYLADLYSLRPHFPRSMEWLLFTSLETNAKQQEESGLPLDEAGVELIRTAELISQFPQASELVISVARKMDAEMWPSLFQAAGPPTAICESLLRDGQLQHASCCLLIIDEVIGKAEASRLALKTLKLAIAVSNYPLCVDLLRFLASQDQDSNLTFRKSDASDIVDKNNNYVSWLWNWIAPQHEEDDQTADGSVPPPPRESQVHDHEQAILDKMMSSLSLEGDQNRSSTDEVVDPLVEAWRLLAKQAWQLLDSGSVRELASFNKAMDGVFGGLSALFTTTNQLIPCSLGHRTPSASLIANALFISSNEMASASESELESVPGLLESLLRSGNVNYALALAIVANNQKVMQAFMEENRRTWEALQTLISNDVHLCAFSSVLLLAHGTSTLGRTMTI